jgi:hypothetical protein
LVAFWAETRCHVFSAQAITRSAAALLISGHE